MKRIYYKLEKKEYLYTDLFYDNRDKRKNKELEITKISLSYNNLEICSSLLLTFDTIIINLVSFLYPFIL